MKITAGFGEEYGMDPVQTIEMPDGNPVRIEGLGLVLAFRDGVLEIRSENRGFPTVRPVSGNVIEVRHGDDYVIPQS